MARRGETGDDPASTMSAGGSHGESTGATGLYNVSNTCYLNSVLQALSHVREFRECLLSDEAGVSLYAAGPGRGRSPGRTPVPTPAEEILSFPGFKKKRKRKKGDNGDEEEETTVVPVLRPPAMTRTGRANIADADHASLGGELRAVLRTLWSGEYAAFPPYQLLRAVWTLVPSFAGNQQQDAHEFTRFLLERLRSEFVRGDALAEKARRAASLSLSAGAKDPLRRNVTPRGREHGEEGSVMHELGIPNPIRRSRSARAGQRVGGKWTDSPGSISPSGASGDASPGAYTPRGAASPTAIAAGLTAAAMRGAAGEAEAGEEGGFMIVSRWGAVRHKLGCSCRPCKSRRKAEGGDAPGPDAHALPGVPADGGGFPGVALPRAQAEALLAASASPRAPGAGSEEETPLETRTLFQTPPEEKPLARARDAKREPKDSSPTSPTSPTLASDVTDVTRLKSRANDADANDADAKDASQTPSQTLDGAGLPTDPVWRLFGGMALSRICCTRCGHASTRREPFLDISLPIPTACSSPLSSPRGDRGDRRDSAGASSPRAPTGEKARERVTLQQCLAAHTRDETLAGQGARFYCERCGDVGGATKQNKLQTLPPVLCLHLKRFTWRGSGARSKLDAHVEFPLHSLDLTPYMETADGEGAPGPRLGRAAAETAAAAAEAAAEMADMASEMAEGAVKRPRRASSGASAFGEAAAAKAAAAGRAAAQAREAAAMAMASWIDADEGGSKAAHMYDLAAAVVHHGAGAGSGHYTVFAREGDAEDDENDETETETEKRDGVWAQFNDDKVIAADPEEVRNAGGYLFFYTRRETRRERSRNPRGAPGEGAKGKGGKGKR